MARFKKGAYFPIKSNKKFTDYLGYITPIFVADCIPGDRWDHKIHALIRTQPLLAPVMHEVDVELHAYFCPDRILWEDSEDFYTGGDLGTANPVRPTMEAPAVTGYEVGSLADYLQLPVGIPGYVHDARPFRMYNTIFNHHYRDSQLQSEQTISFASGLDTTTARDILRPAWKRDYFTKARPEPQLGAEVVIPLTGDADIIPDPSQPYPTFDGIGGTTFTDQSLKTNASANLQIQTGGGNNTLLEWNTPGLLADLSAVTGIGIRELREAGSVQRYLEANNIWGGRYMEQLMSRFGVLPQDSRLQWPEFLGAGNTRIQFSEVLQTAEGEDPVGEMRGHGISIVGSNRYRYPVKEHGWIMVFMITRPKAEYHQGLDRMWSRETRYDYLNPEFVHIGDQAILNKELYVNAANPNGVFGYTPIFDEYRSFRNYTAGEFRPGQVLDYWTLTRHFSSEPALNADFIECNPSPRVFPAPEAAHLYVSAKHSGKVWRQLPKFPKYRLM